MSASALQMAMVAGSVANGGVMTPHVMAYIDDTKGNGCPPTSPPVDAAISAQTAATLTTYMQGVTATRRHRLAWLPASRDVAAKTGTAQTGSCGPNPPFTNDWLIAFAPVGNTKVAIAVVFPTNRAAPPAPPIRDRS